MENKNISKVKRGEIYLYDFGTNEGSIQNGLRPALVVQCDEGNKASCTTVIAAMTTVIKKRYLPSHIILGDRFGLKEPSMVMLEQLRTVNQADLLEYIGRIDDEHCMKKINIGVKKALGLWVDKPYRKPADMRCLCVKCLESYKNSPNYIVKRLDPFAKAKDKCDKCQSYGYDYLVIERSKGGVMMNNTPKKENAAIELFSGFGNSDFRMKIGGTVYEVSTHFDPEGSRCVLQQFRDLILSEDLLENRIIAENAKAQ